MMLSVGVILLAISSLVTGNHRPRLDGRIVGGHDVNIEDYPYQLSLRDHGRHICGASIISATWAVTAAHCVHDAVPSAISLQAGSSVKGSGGSIHQAALIARHHKYHGLDYDYALIEVKEPFNLSSSGIQAIKLTTSEPIDNTLLSVSGWGTTSSGGISPKHLKAVDVHTINRQICNENYKTITDRMICAADTGKDSCQGDSGGPLVDRASNEQVGIVSWGRGCAQKGYPGVYSNIAAERDWFKKVAGV